MELGSLTDVGMEREHNEDNVLVTRFQFFRGSRRTAYTMLILSDGMGGAAAGEVASRMVVQSMATMLYRDLLDAHLNLNQQYVNVEKLLIAAVSDVNERVHSEAQDRPGCRGMGATLTVGVLCQGKLFVAHVGDSRLYLLRNNRLLQLTRDHSLVGELLREGRITEEQARHHPRKNVITRAVGSRPTLQVDAFCELIEAGDAILLCSDGLSGMVRDEEIRTSMALGLKRRSGLEAISRELVRMANEAGGSDNISVILAQVRNEDIPPQTTELVQLENEATLSWDAAIEYGFHDASFATVDD